MEVHVPCLQQFISKDVPIFFCSCYIKVGVMSASCFSNTPWLAQVPTKWPTSKIRQSDLQLQDQPSLNNNPSHLSTLAAGILLKEREQKAGRDLGTGRKWRMNTPNERRWAMFKGAFPQAPWRLAVSFLLTKWVILGGIPMIRSWRLMEREL